MTLPRAFQQAIALRNRPSPQPRPAPKPYRRPGQPIEIDRSTVPAHHFKRRLRRINDQN